ncbi:hypothetical protein [Streptomyces sp.]
MSEANTPPEHTARDAAGRHRGQASHDEAEKAPPHGKHRRPSEG